MNAISQPRTLSTNFSAFVRKKSVLATTCGLLIGTTALILTNPGKTAYVDHASERLAEEFKQSCDEYNGEIDVTPLLSLPVSDLCKAFVGNADLVGRGASKLFIETSTKRRNLGVFSIYTTNAFGRTFRTVGVGRQFIIIYGK
jgi:Domain of unknown function (DUF4359)